MQTGMLWLDDDKRRSVDEKVRRAVAYYREKYGRQPDLCLVHKAALKGERRIDAVQVQPARTVLPHHFWLGQRGE